jgi:hypothetical protein
MLAHEAVSQGTVFLKRKQPHWNSNEAGVFCVSLRG